jgi:hypothetical protein
VHCGLNLRCRGASANVDYSYYKDMAKARQYDCPAGGYLQVRTDLVSAQFGDLLQGLRLPPYWREIIREKMLEAARQTGVVDTESVEREKERLKLKRGRVLKQHREGYIDDEEFEGEMAAVELALHALEVPELDGVSLDEVIAAGERLPGMTALWGVATVEERRDMVMLILEPGGLHYDVEMKEIAAFTPRPAFLPVLRLLEGVVEYEEATGTLVTRRWQQRNRRATSHRSHLSLVPLEKLFPGRNDLLIYRHPNVDQLDISSLPQRRPGLDDPHWKIPATEWPIVLHRVDEGDPLRKVASDYGVSYETVRRVIRAARAGMKSSR